MTAQPVYADLEQGTPEWHALRKTKITATDAPIIMGASHWKTKVQLYYDKISSAPPPPPNDRMQRGLDLEEAARDVYILDTGVFVFPKIVIRDWAMASLDGISDCGNVVVEIKCPGEKDHSIALAGKVPDHYYPQLQHQMYVCDIEEMHYFSFDGIDGSIVKVVRDDDYIAKMIVDEKKFYDCLTNRIPPEPSEGDYVERNDEVWVECALRWKSIKDSITELEKEEEELRKQLIFLSGESNTKGAGISLCQVQRKGNVDYSKVPQLKGIDLEPYRKETISSWRITA